MMKTVSIKNSGTFPRKISLLRFSWPALALTLLLLSSQAFSQPEGGNWVPSAPGKVTFVRYDFTRSYTEVRVELRENSGTLAAYFYRFDPNNASQVSRANGLYTAFLSAQASGTGVIVYLMASTGQINAVQVGD
jgi:hypothetical protein